MIGRDRGTVLLSHRFFGLCFIPVFSEYMQEAAVAAAFLKQYLLSYSLLHPVTRAACVVAKPADKRMMRKGHIITDVSFIRNLA